MNLLITDPNYLESFERLEKMLWFKQHKPRLFFSVLVIIYSIFQISYASKKIPTDLNEKSNLGADYGLFLSDYRFWYFVILLALIVILYSLYRRYVSSKKTFLMKEYEGQTQKSIVKYDIDETRIRLESNAFTKEFKWNSFQKFTVFNEYLIISNPYRLVDTIWIRLDTIDADVGANLMTMVRSKIGP